jgi:hypothetical protein
MSKTTISIEANLGKRSLSIIFISGYMTDASNSAMVKGKKTEDVIFNTPPAITQQIKTIKKKDARPELNVLKTFFIF